MANETKTAYDLIPVLRQAGKFPRDAEMLTIAKYLLLQAELARKEGCIIHDFHLKSCQLDNFKLYLGIFHQVKMKTPSSRMDLRDIASVLVQISGLEIIDKFARSEDAKKRAQINRYGWTTSHDALLESLLKTSRRRLPKTLELIQRLMGNINLREAILKAADN